MGTRTAGQQWPSRRTNAGLATVSAVAAIFMCHPAGHTAQAQTVKVELNKLEQIDTNCRAYVVIDNQDAAAFSSFKVDLVMFQTDGIIGRRFALNLGPVASKKRSVKLFDMDSTRCDAVGSFLVNDVVECKSGGTALEDCVDRLAVSSLAKAQLTK